MVTINNTLEQRENKASQFFKNLGYEVSTLFEGICNHYNLRVGGVKHSQDLAWAFGITSAVSLDISLVQGLYGTGDITHRVIDTSGGLFLGVVFMSLAGEYLAKSKYSLDYKDFRPMDREHTLFGW